MFKCRTKVEKVGKNALFGGPGKTYIPRDWWVLQENV